MASYPAVYAALRNAAGLATQSAAQLQCAQLVLELPLLPAGTRGEEALQALVQGAVLSNWAFDGYLTDPKRKFHRIQEVVLVPHPQDQQLGDPAMQPALQRAIQVTALEDARLFMLSLLLLLLLLCVCVCVCVCVCFPFLVCRSENNRGLRVVHHALLGKFLSVTVVVLVVSSFMLLSTQTMGDSSVFFSLLPDLLHPVGIVRYLSFLPC